MISEFQQGLSGKFYWISVTLSSRRLGYVKLQSLLKPSNNQQLISTKKNINNFIYST